MMKTRVLFFLHNGVGGAERMTLNIANILPLDTYEIIICKVNTPYIIQNGRIDDFIPPSFKITNIAWNNQFSFLHQIYKTIKTFNPKIIFSSLMPYNQRLLLLRPLFKNIKFIVRNDNYLFTINRLKRISIKYTYRLADDIIAQTQEMKDELVHIGLQANKIHVLHNFIEEKAITEKASMPSPFKNDSKIRFVSVGRLAHQKGFDILIKAFKLVNNIIQDSELYIIGSSDGDSRKIYESLIILINQLKLKDKVFFTGYTDNPYRYIKNATVYVLSSRFEGLPNVLIESQFLNIPAAATKCIPIISRIIKEGQNGFLASNENPESLSEAMIAASKLKNTNIKYTPAKKEDFLCLFI